MAHPRAKAKAKAAATTAKAGRKAAKAKAKIKTKIVARLRPKVKAKIKAKIKAKTKAKEKAKMRQKTGNPQGDLGLLQKDPAKESQTNLLEKARGKVVDVVAKAPSVVGAVGISSSHHQFMDTIGSRSRCSFLSTYLLS